MPEEQHSACQKRFYAIHNSFQSRIVSLLLLLSSSRKNVWCAPIFYYLLLPCTPLPDQVHVLSFWFTMKVSAAFGGTFSRSELSSNNAVIVGNSGKVPWLQDRWQNFTIYPRPLDCSDWLHPLWVYNLVVDMRLASTLVKALLAMPRAECRARS